MDTNSNNYFESLEKIANELALDENQEPMVDDPAPAVPSEEVEAAQAINSEDADPAAAEEQHPTSPEDTEELEASLQAAEEEYQAAQEQLAEVTENFMEFEKTAAPVLSESLPAMGAFAKLIDFSSNPDSDPVLHKLAQERLQTALSSEDQFIETLQKTAQELFEDEENLNALYTDEGMKYVVDTLDSFADDDEISKQAFEAGAVLGKAVDTIKEFGSATKNFWKLKNELGVAKAEVDRTADALKQVELANSAKGSDVVEGDAIELGQALTSHMRATSDHDDVQRKVLMGAAGWGTGGVGAAAGSLYGGKKVYDHLHPEQEEDELLDSKTASVNGYSQNYSNYQGGKRTMTKSVVQDFLKIAGAAQLMNIANNEQFNDGIRKEATEQFNAIARMSRRDMDEAFAKVATALYTEQELHEIVAGYHNEELFDKVAFFLACNEASADELEKVAGADGVAAKGVAGALTDAKKNVEEHIEEEKRKSENSRAGDQPGTLPAQDTSGYNVTNNPEKYDVSKTAMLEQAYLQKQAAIEAYNEAEYVLQQYSRY